MLKTIYGKLITSMPHPKEFLMLQKQLGANEPMVLADINTIVSSKIITSGKDLITSSWLNEYWNYPSAQYLQKTSTPGMNYGQYVFYYFLLDKKLWTVDRREKDGDKIEGLTYWL